MGGKNYKVTFRRKIKNKFLHFKARAIAMLFTRRLKKVPYRFILSPGRTGTRTLGLLFDQLDRCISRHEPRPSVLDLTIAAQEGEMNSVEISNSFLQKRALYSYRAAKEQVPFVESNYAVTHFFGLLHQEIPNIRAVFISRHPVEYVRSAYSKEHATSRKPHRLFDVRDDRKRIASDYFLKWCTDDFDSLSRFEKICWNYRLFHEEYIRLISTGIEIPFYTLEDLVTDENKIVQLATDLKILLSEKDKKILTEGMKHSRNGSDTYLKGDMSTWTNKEKSQFNLIIGPIIPKIGYDLKED